MGKINHEAMRRNKLAQARTQKTQNMKNPSGKSVYAKKKKNGISTASPFWEAKIEPSTIIAVQKNEEAMMPQRRRFIWERW